MPKTQMERLWTVMAVVVAFVLVLIGYVMLISPQRSQTSQVNAQVATAQQQNNTLAARISSLTAQNKNLASYQKSVAAAGAALPSTSGLPDFLRTLQAIGNATLTNVAALTVGTPTGFVKTGATPSATPTATSTATPTTQTTAKPSAPSIYVLPVTAQVTGTPAQLSEFLRQLQSVQPRAVLITQIGETSGNGSGAASKTSAASIQLNMSIFVQPGGPSAAPSTGTS